MHELLQQMSSGAVERPGARGVDVEVRLLIDDVLGDDWARALSSQRLLVEHYLPWLERRSVRRARAAGRSWAGIARVMRRARQTVRERFAVLESEPSLSEMLPPTLPAPDAERDHATFAERVAEIRRRRDADEAAAVGSLVAW